MKVSIEEASLNTALQLAKEGKYREALSLFATVESYESLLNQIGCACCLKDNTHACELFNKALGAYGTIHNCYKDVASLGNSTKIVCSYFGGYTKQLADAIVCKQSVKRKLVGKYNVESLWEDDEFSLDVLEELMSEKPQVQTGIFDVNSPEYFDSLITTWSNQFFVEGGEKLNQTEETILQIDTNYMPLMALQVAICKYRRDWEKGEKFVEKFADMPNCTTEAIADAIQLIVWQDPDNVRTDLLQKLLQKIVWLSSEVTEFALAEFIYYASTVVGDNQLASQLADKLYARCEQSQLGYVHLCAYAFYNNGELDRAKQAAKILTSTYPDFSLGKLLLNYLNNPYPIVGDKLAIPHVEAIRYTVPRQFYMHFVESVRSRREADKLVLKSEDLPYVMALSIYASQLLDDGELTDFLQVMQAIDYVITYSVIDDVVEFICFARQFVANSVVYSGAKEYVISRLLYVNYKEDFIVALDDDYYLFDAHNYKWVDMLHLKALSFCAIFTTISVEQFNELYAELASVVKMEYTNKEDTVMKCAFAVLLMSGMELPEGVLRTIESRDNKEFYNAYLQNKKN